MAIRKEEWQCEKCNALWPTEEKAIKCEHSHLDPTDCVEMSVNHEKHNYAPYSLVFTWVVPVEEEEPGTMREIRCVYHRTRDGYSEKTFKKED